MTSRSKDRHLVRVFAGRDHSTGKRRYCHAPVHGTEAQADKHLAEMQFEVDHAPAPRTPTTPEMALRPWLGPLLRRVQPALGPLLAGATTVVAPSVRLAMAGAAGVAGAALAVWQQAQLERFLDAFEERMVGFASRVVDEKWAEGLSPDAVETIMHTLARTHLIVGEKKLAAVASLVVGACVADPPKGVTRTDLLEILVQLNETDIRIFADLWRHAHGPGHPGFITRDDVVRPPLYSELADGVEGIRPQLARLQAAGLVYNREALPNPEAMLPETLSIDFTQMAQQLVAVAQDGGWLVGP